MSKRKQFTFYKREQIDIKGPRPFCLSVIITLPYMLDFLSHYNVRSPFANGFTTLCPLL